MFTMKNAIGWIGSIAVFSDKEGGRWLVAPNGKRQYVKGGSK